MPWVGFKPTILLFEREKLFLALYGAATVIGELINIFFPLALQPNFGLGRLHGTFPFTSVTKFTTVGRTPWTGDQLVARPLPKHRTTQTQKKNTHIDIRALSGIGTHTHSTRASEDKSCLTPFGYRDRLRIHRVTSKKWNGIEEISLRIFSNVAVP
jgi:hypothetical protein